MRNNLMTSNHDDHAFPQVCNLLAIILLRSVGCSVLACSHGKLRINDDCSLFVNDDDDALSH